MRKRQNAKSLGAVHTHTHTHTHTNPYSMEKFGYSKTLCQQSRFVGQSGESKRVKNSCSRFDEPKTVNIWKIIEGKCNIKLGYMEMATSFLGIAEPFVRRKCT